MKYTILDAPAPAFLVTAVVPNLVQGALVPGDPCPCVDIPLTPSILGRSVIVRSEMCEGVRIRLTVTTMVKQVNPYDSGTHPDQYADWENAWDTITHTVEEKIIGEEISTVTVFNQGADDEQTIVVPCGLIETTADEWVPGEPSENPGFASYDVEITKEEEFITGEVGEPVLPGFQGDFSAFGGFSSISKSVGGKQSLASKTQWRWTLSLEDWPVSRSWPEGFVLRGSIVWNEATTRYPSENVTQGAVRAERFSLSQFEPKWEGALHSTLPAQFPDEGETVTKSAAVLQGFEILLPFA